MSLAYFPINSRKTSHKKRQESHQAEPFFAIENEIKFKNGLLTMITQQAVERHPHNCVGVIIVTDNNNNIGHGTAFLIGPNLALTAAHNIGTFQEGKFTHYKRIVFYPGLSSASSNKARYRKIYRNAQQEQYDACGIKVKSFKYPRQYETQKTLSKNCQYDYALLQLQQDIHREKYFELGINYKPKDEEIFNIGYQKGDVNYQDECGIQKRGSAKGTHYLKDNFILCHKISTQPGNSGGPIYVNRREMPIAIAIHKGSDFEEQHNLARVISRQVLDNLWVWEKEFYLENFVSCITAYMMTESSYIMPQQIRCFEEKIENSQSKSKEIEILKEVIQKLQQEAEKSVKQQSVSMQEKLQQSSHIQNKPVLQEAKSKFIKSIPKLIENRKQNVENRKVFKVSKYQQFWDNNTPFAKRFKINQQTVTYAFQDFTRYQITSCKPLLQYSVIKMRVKYGGRRSICIGILTEARKKYQSSGERGSGQNESIGYWLHPSDTTGEVIENGEQCHCRNKSLFVHEGSQITIEFDLQGRLIFYNQVSLKKIRVQLRNKFIDKDIYLFVSMANKNDEIKVTSF